MYWTDGSYFGPAAIVNAHRFIFDSRDQGAEERLEILNDREGVWRCRTTFNCTEACPRGIEITKAIQEVKQALLFRRDLTVCFSSLSLCQIPSGRYDSQWISHTESSPELLDDRGLIRPECPAGKPQHQRPVERQCVLPLLIGPPVGDAEVESAVHLGDDAPTVRPLPARVQVAPGTVPVTAYDLASWHG